MNQTEKIRFMRSKKTDYFWRDMIIPVIIFICLLLFFFAGIQNVSSASEDESRQILQDAVLRAAVQCYAIEGMYPPEVKYMEEHYGLDFDRDRFIIHYEVFAGNILPDITVIDLGM